MYLEILPCMCGKVLKNMIDMADESMWAWIIIMYDICLILVKMILNINNCYIIPSWHETSALEPSQLYECIRKHGWYVSPLGQFQNDESGTVSLVVRY